MIIIITSIAVAVIITIVIVSVSLVFVRRNINEARQKSLHKVQTVYAYRAGVCLCLSVCVCVCVCVHNIPLMFCHYYIFKISAFDSRHATIIIQDVDSGELILRHEMMFQVQVTILVIIETESRTN